jgi:hypothetical protein
VPVTVILGEPIVPAPGEKAQQLLRRTRAAMEALLDDAQRSYPAEPAGPDDRWWLPVHLGGTAPTPEEAAVQDSARAAGHGPRAKKSSPLSRLTARISRR